MECSICFEKFIFIKSKEDWDTEKKKFYKKYENTFDKEDKFADSKIFWRFRGLLNTSTKKCETLNCDCILCDECWFRIRTNGKKMYDADFDDFLEPNDLYRCPLCRQVDWKYQMERVHSELLQKLLSKDELIEIITMNIRNNLWKY